MHKAREIKNKYLFANNNLEVIQVAFYRPKTEDKYDI